MRQFRAILRESRGSRANHEYYAARSSEISMPLPFPFSADSVAGEWQVIGKGSIGYQLCFLPKTPHAAYSGGDCPNSLTAAWEDSDDCIAPRVPGTRAILRFNSLGITGDWRCNCNRNICAGSDLLDSPRLLGRRFESTLEQLKNGKASRGMCPRFSQPLVLVEGTSAN